MEGKQALYVLWSTCEKVFTWSISRLLMTACCNSRGSVCQEEEEELIIIE